MRWFTYTRSNKKWRVGCFYGTGEELIKKAYADSDTSGKCYEAIVRAMEVIETAMKDENENTQEDNQNEQTRNNRGHHQEIKSRG